MHVVVSGATGFLGRRLVRVLLESGDQVVALSRDPARARNVLGSSVNCVSWSASEPDGAWRGAIAESDAVVNLAGEPIADGRWTEQRRERILASRVGGTRAIVDAVLRASHRPSVFVSASGVDYYGTDRGDEPLDEGAAQGEGFLATVCEAWENEAKRVATAGVREVRLRTGVVLGHGGGALARMLTPYRFFVGGPVGSGKQWVPWISLDDWARLVRFAIARPSVSGPINATGPQPVTMRELGKAIGRALRRPSWLRVPSFAVRAAFGELSTLILGSKRVLPARSLAEGFEFLHATVDAALEAVIAERRV